MPGLLYVAGLFIAIMSASSSGRAAAADVKVDDKTQDLIATKLEQFRQKLMQKYHTQPAKRIRSSKFKVGDESSRSKVVAESSRSKVRAASRCHPDLDYSDCIVRKLIPSQFSEQGPDDVKDFAIWPDWSWVIVTDKKQRNGTVAF